MLISMSTFQVVVSMSLNVGVNADLDILLLNSFVFHEVVMAFRVVGHMGRVLHFDLLRKKRTPSLVSSERASERTEG